MHRMSGLRFSPLLSSCKSGAPAPAPAPTPAPSPSRTCYFCRGDLPSDKSLYRSTRRHQSVHTVIRSKTERIKKKTGKYAELLEIDEKAANQTEAKISPLRAKHLSRLVDDPEISLERLHELKRGRRKCSELKVDIDLLRDVESKILKNYKREVSLREDDCAVVFASEVAFDAGLFRRKEGIELLKDSYDKFRRDTVGEQKLTDLRHAIDDGLDRGATEIVKSPHAMFREHIEKLRNKSDLDISRLDILDVRNKRNTPPTKKLSFKEKSNGAKKVLLHREQTDVQDKAKENSLARLLMAHFEVCNSVGMTNKAHLILKHYMRKSRRNPTIVNNVGVFNTVIQGFASKGNYNKICDVLKMMNENSVSYDEETFSLIFECVDKADISDKMNILKIYEGRMSSSNIKLNDLIIKPFFTKEQKNSILNSIRLLEPNFEPIYEKPDCNYDCPLLMHMNKDSDVKVSSPARGVCDAEELAEKVRLQLENEERGYVELENINVPAEITEHTLYCRNVIENLEKTWKESIRTALASSIPSLKAQCQGSSIAIHIYPYFKLLDIEEFVNIVMMQVKKLATGSETFSPRVRFLQKEMGQQVLMRYEILKKKQSGEVADTLRIYREYCDWYLNRPACETYKNSRKKWQEILHKNAHDVCIYSFRHNWPSSVCISVGKFLFNIMINNTQIDINILKKTSKSKKEMPAFYNVFRNYGYILNQEVKPHPVLAKLFRDSMPSKLEMETIRVPSFSPPVPWINDHYGGYVISKVPIMRVLSDGVVQLQKLKDIPTSKLYPVLDSLNQLSAIPWKINKPVLDLMIHVFREGGSKELTIAQPPQAISMPMPPSASLSKKERAEEIKKRAVVARVRQEMFSLWCDLLYKLSLANHFRDDTFWLPHNMDFRGRVYPCPPHLSHLGADTARSLLLFARGEKLGAEGLRWLKLHCINLTGTMKRHTVQERLDYVETILDDILDSADHPLDGKKWWTQSETPWQTLACCKEIANATRSPDPEEYVCHFPVHQDGSCNGLQHYAALGGDAAGARSVNLCLDDRPQDVYSSVVNLVEKRRAKDAAQGVKIAQELEGFVKRKVIKQTVMTTVYGVTRYGARLQIAKQLKAIEGFPSHCVWSASAYLTSVTFESLEQMFTSTKEIQDWLTDTAKAISGICKDKVEWVTPLGLPVVQPYHKNLKTVTSPPTGKISEYIPCDLFEKPSTVKQKNAFPPNFIHSLDSSHMMLTSLHCEASNITFVSVHDCFWTHPSSVKIMNEICREQFVALHSQPILEDLSKFMLDRYVTANKESLHMKLLKETDMEYLVTLFGKLPKKGSFKLKEVLKSVYFFS